MTINLDSTHQVLQETEIEKEEFAERLHENRTALEAIAGQRDWSLDAAGLVNAALQDKDNENAALHQAVKAMGMRSYTYTWPVAPIYVACNPNIRGIGNGG